MMDDCRTETRKIATMLWSIGLSISAIGMFALAMSGTTERLRNDEPPLVSWSWNNLRLSPVPHGGFAQRHPLFFDRPPLEEDSIRFLTLGSSMTWGSPLKRDNDNHYQFDNNYNGKKDFGYAWLLSPSVHNAATRTGGPALSALCTQTIVGDDSIYDVIVLEFSLSSLNASTSNKKNDGDNDVVALYVLAQRLRQRFPSATIIFVQLWSPSQFAYRHTTVGDDSDERATKFVSFDEWRLQASTSPSSPFALDSDEFQAAIQNYDWVYMSNDNDVVKVKEARLHQTVESVQGHLVRLPRDKHPQTALSSVHRYFQDATIRSPNKESKQEYSLVRRFTSRVGHFNVNSKNNHGNDAESDDLMIPQDDSDVLSYALSREGHEWIASAIQDVVEKEAILQRAHRNELGSWGVGDSCRLWYETGRGLPTQNTIPLHSFSMARDKFALEVSARTNANKRSLTIDNPFDTERTIHLSYMTTSSSNLPHKIYPRTKVQLNGKPSVLLDPYHLKEQESDGTIDRLQVVRTTAIGKVPPHSSMIIRLDPLEQTLSPFRVVGVSLLFDPASVPSMEQYDDQQHAQSNHKSSNNIFQMRQKRNRIRTEFAFSPEPAYTGRSNRQRW